MNEEEADPSTNIRGEWICARVRYRFREEEQSDALVFSFATTCRHFPKGEIIGDVRDFDRHRAHRRRRGRHDSRSQL